VETYFVGHAIASQVVDDEFSLVPHVNVRLQVEQTDEQPRPLVGDHTGGAP
jgi:hypothetical protein